MWYPLENRPIGCTDHEGLGDYDDRYETIGYQTNEFETQNASGALLRLRILPLFVEKYFPAKSYESIKSITHYDFWVRPAIEWKLSCEQSTLIDQDAQTSTNQDPVTRSQIVNAFNFEVEEVAE